MKENNNENEKGMENDGKLSKKEMIMKRKGNYFISSKHMIFGNLSSFKKKIYDSPSPHRKKIPRRSVSDKYLEKLTQERTLEDIRHTPVYEILGIKRRERRNYDKILTEFKNYENQFNINISYTNKKNLKFDIPIETSKIINILSLPTELRTFDDIFTIKKYLLTTKLEHLFKDEFNNKEESIDKLLTFFGLEMKYKLFEKDDIVFKIGDSSVYLYLIIHGKAEILKPVVEIKYLTGYEYFSYLLDLKNNFEEYLLNLSINENISVYDMERSHMELLPSIYVLNILEKYKIYQNINLEEELNFVGIDPVDLGLDPLKLKSHEYIYLRIKQIKRKLSNIKQDLVDKYKYIVDHNNKKQVRVYKYLSFLKLEKDNFFGESAMGEKEKRNASIKVIEDSYLGYLSASLYKTNFYAEKKLVLENKINFLHSKFFFNKITLKRFEKKYFNSFILESYKNGTIIYNENDPINYVYFIEEGTIELSSSKTMLQIEIFLQGLQKKVSLKEEPKVNTYKNISSTVEDLQAYLNKTQKNKLLIVGKNEIIGLESFYYNIPYFTTAKVISLRAKLFKIGKDQLKQIFAIETDSFYQCQNLVLNKTKILKNRLFGINNIKLSILDEKINFDYEHEYYKNLEKKRKSKDEHIKASQKNNLLFNEIKMKTLFKSRTNRNDSSLLPLINDTSEEINRPNKNKKKEKKINYYSLFRTKDIKRRKANSSSLILNNYSEQERGSSINQINISRNKNAYLEDILLNKAKKQIRLLSKNKLFLSKIKLPLKKNQTLDVKEENNNNKNSEENNDINVNNKESLKKFSNNDLDPSVKDYVSHNLINIYPKKQSIKNNLFETQIKFFKNNNNENNSISSVLPSIFSTRNNKHENIHRNKSLFSSDYHNNSCIINYDKNICKSGLSPNNNRSNLSSFFVGKINKNFIDKGFIGLSIKKFSNFYEMRNCYQKDKFNFYNNSEFFGYKKRTRNENILNNKKISKSLIPSLKIKNKEIISKIVKNKNVIIL